MTQAAASSIASGQASVRILDSAIELFDVEAGKLTAVDAKTSGELKQLLIGSRFYRHDAVLRRRHGAAISTTPFGS